MRADINTRSASILKKIVEYCRQIEDATERFGISLDSLKADVDYRNAVSMCILQIGELTTHLPDEFLVKHKEMPWKEMRNMRNIAAHHYGSFDVQILWDTIQYDIKPLHSYCQQCIDDLSK